ncbi:MAG: cell division protein FtsQ [Lachnospiraceae bacterium]|nr:cell division protein FtsQ [Lachnospiraceae bacterium]
MKEAFRMFKNSKILRVLLTAVIIMAAVCGLLLFLWHHYSITSVTVTGNSHYTSDEIKEMVFTGPYSYNSLVLSVMYRDRTIKDIPFIEKMDVDIVSANSVRINVYEKAVAGYVEYLGHYMYFDKDGIVVESSNRVIEGIPFVTGLSYDHVVLHEQLPVKKPAVFLTILNVTQLLGKYDISTDRIAFDADERITLYFGNARVFLGTDDFIDEKINEMHLLLPQLRGYSGTLHMENYVGEEVNFSFDMDKEETEDTEAAEGEDGEAAEGSEEGGEEGAGTGNGDGN